MPDPLVSLQDRTFVGSGQNRHLTFGRLVGTNLAVFILPADVEVRENRPVEVVIGPVDVDETSVIERFPPWHIEVVSLDSSVNSRVCIVRLMHRSAYATPVTTFDPVALLGALTADGDIPSALSSQGLSLPPATDPRLTDTMEQILEIEALQAKRPPRIIAGRTPDEIVRCIVSPKCQPDPPPEAGSLQQLPVGQDDAPDR